MTGWLPLFLVCAAPLVRAEGHAEQLTAAGVAEFTAAYQAWDGRRFAAAAAIFRQAGTNAPGSSLPFYWLGAAEFHRVIQLRRQPASRSNAAAAAAALEASVEALETALDRDGQNAECHAMLGTLYGMKIDGKLWRALRYGPRVEAHRREALKCGRENPRVHYLLGMCRLQTAKKASARREALAALLAADRLFAAEAQRPAGPLEPRWGWSSCLTFIGRTYELLDQPKEAARYFRKALKQHPVDQVARAGLARVAGSP